MKTLIPFLLALFLCSSLSAQSPEPIVSFAIKSMPMAYYKQQQAAWKKVIDQNPSNAGAWYNLYYATRILSYNDTTETRSREQVEAAIQSLISDMGKAVPDSYEYNLCKWMAGGHDMKLLPYLEKAAALGPDRTEHLAFMINIGEVTRDKARRNSYAKKLFDAGLISSGMTFYNYNVIMGLPPNAILVTSGDNDTYPVWALQGMGLRPDVTVVNTNLVYLDDYRTKLFAELGMDKWTLTAADHGNAFKAELARRLAANRKGFPLHIALTTGSCGNQFINIDDKLYLTGLSYQYSEKPIDNMALLRRNFEQVYALDYISKAFYHEISADLVKYINTNYTVPMLKLYEHYKSSGDAQHREWMRGLLLAVTQGTDSETEVRKALTE